MQKQIKAPSITQTTAYWDKSIDFYAKFDSTLQSFYFSIVNMLKLEESHSILQVGCGRCLLVPYVLQIKPKQTRYIATDLSQKMVESAEQRICSHFSQYESILTVQEWMQQNNLELKVANGQEPLGYPYKFDRIICNMVIMLTEDAEKMLINLYNEAQPGCLLGISTWGIKALNLYHSVMSEAVEKNGLHNEIPRCNYYLYNKLGEIAQKLNWKVVVQWEQVSPYPYLQAEAMKEHSRTSISNMKFGKEEKEKIHQTFMEDIKKKFDQHCSINFSSQIYILKKCS